jgi:hypothetical protein
VPLLLHSFRLYSLCAVFAVRHKCKPARVQSSPNPDFFLVVPVAELLPPLGIERFDPIKNASQRSQLSIKSTSLHGI